jgi:hypothetical protein
MSRQTAASARLAVVDIVKAMEEEADILRTATLEIGTVFQLIKGYDDQASWPAISDQWLESCSRVGAQMDEVHEYLVIGDNRHPEDTYLNDARKELINSTGSLSTALALLVDAFKQQAFGQQAPGRPALTPERIDKQREEIEARYKAWEHSQIKMFGLLKAEIQNAWWRVRELERLSLPPMK